MDSSAGAIMACGLIEIAKAVADNEKSIYLNGSIEILKALDHECGIWDLSSHALLKNGTSQYLPSNGPWQVENGSLIYGDYYFLEAIIKLRKSYSS